MKVQVNDAERSQKELLVEIPYEVFEQQQIKSWTHCFQKQKYTVSAQVKHLEKLLENSFPIKLNHRLLKKL